MNPWLVLAALLLVTAASAETITVGNYSVSFEYNSPYSIETYNESDSFDMKILDGNFFARINASVADPGVPWETNQLASVNGEVGTLSTAGKAFMFRSHRNLPLYLVGEVPFYDLADLLRSLKITPLQN